MAAMRWLISALTQAAGLRKWMVPVIEFIACCGLRFSVPDSCRSTGVYKLKASSDCGVKSTTVKTIFPCAITEGYAHFIATVPGYEAQLWKISG